MNICEGADKRQKVRTLDFFTNDNYLQNPIKESLGNPRKIEKFPNVFVDKGTMDWLLQTMLFQSKNANSASKPSLAMRNPPSEESKNEKILKEISQFSQFCRRMRCIKDCKATQQNLRFVGQIEEKLRCNAYCHTTQQEAQEAQKFLYLQMDKRVWNLYQRRPKQLQELMDKAYQFYAKKENLSKNLALGDEELRIVETLLEYGVQTESQDLENLFHHYLLTLPKTLKDSAKNGEIETKCLKEIEQNINTYRSDKMKLMGFNFFATEALLPQEQEAITDSIAKVLSFYSQPNTMEVNGYKISWQPKQPNLQDYHSLYSIDLAIKNAQNAEIKIEFQVLIIFPTKFQNKLES